MANIEQRSTRHTLAGSFRLLRLIQLLAPLCVLAFVSAPSFAQQASDTVVIRVTSPRGVAVAFSGVVTLRDAKTERRLENVRTPFELRLPAQNLEARFSADDGAALGGEIISYKAGVQHGQVTGHVYVGQVRLYFEPSGSFGFGPRLATRPRP